MPRLRLRVDGPLNRYRVSAAPYRVYTLLVRSGVSGRRDRGDVDEWEKPLSREAVVRETFADIDALDLDRFVAHLTEDVVFRFGNAEPAVGRAAVKEAVGQFFSTIQGLTHHIKNVWDVGDTTIVQIDIEYVRTDGRCVTIPNADILTYDGDLVRDWLIYIDVAPVYAEQ
jgi:ketosteroid isomerase-like protein